MGMRSGSDLDLVLACLGCGCGLKRVWGWEGVGVRECLLEASVGGVGIPGFSSASFVIALLFVLFQSETTLFSFLLAVALLSC